MPKQRIHLTPAEAIDKGWQCKKHLKAIGLMPAQRAQPVGSVWQGQGAYSVYDPADCIPYRWQPGPAQLYRQSVAAKARALMDGNCLVLDTETTGKGEEAEVCEIAIIDATGTVLLNSLIRPTQPIPAGAFAVHGISNDMVANAPSWPEVAEQYAAIVEGRKVVMYNAPFDVRLLAQTHSRHEVAAPPLASVCAMRLYAEWFGDRGRDGLRWVRLVEAADECGVWEEGAHRAHADARMTLEVLRFMQRSMNGRFPSRSRKTGAKGSQPVGCAGLEQVHQPAQPTGSGHQPA
ncbi:3'-5' exonuclease [Pseudomonas gingeri]